MPDDSQAGKRGYSWPAAEPGNRLAEVHGARSERTIGPLAEQIAAAILADPDCPAYLHRPEFRSAVDAAARADAVVIKLWDWLCQQDIEAALTEVTTSEETEERSKTRTTRRSTGKRVASVLDQLHKAETRAASARRAIGRDPMSAAQLTKDLSQSRWYAGATPLDKRLAELEAARQAAIGAGEDD